ncbi:MAG: DEAD/DEAH box helicase [Reyranellaceae bacterium]
MENVDTAARQPSLRPYQHAVIQQVSAEIEAGRRRILLVAPTGSGKTVIGARLAGEACARGQRVVFLVHRRELVQQTSQKLHSIARDHGIIAAGFPTRPGEPVQVASIATVHARAVRTASIGLPPADLVIVDEAHHATARTWRRLLDSWPGAIVVGLTATPCRADGRGLGGAFETMVCCPSIAELIEGGWLVPTRVYAPTRPDLAGVALRGGDYDEGELAARMDRPGLVGDVVTHWHRLAERRRTIVFASSVGHSLHLRDELGRADVMAAHVDGQTPAAERDAILAGLAGGSIEVVTNCGVLQEGVDIPAVECIVLARPTRSLALYRQTVGRGLRPAAGKDHCLVIDHAGATHEHGFVEDPITWSLAADSRALPAVQLARASPGARVLADCPECSAVRWQGRPCRACGWRPHAKPIVVDVRDGELGQVERDGTIRKSTASEADKSAFYRQLLWIARERGYQPGWASYRHREKFGDWPPTRGAQPMAPSSTVRSWVRSRQIAHARSKAKTGLGARQGAATTGRA